jgi:HAD superfamily phosphoserine phosphatase-like hydrolase
MKKKVEAIICDMDGTLVNYPNEPFRSSWDALAEALPKTLREQWRELRDFYYPKKELCGEWYKKQVALLKGIRLTDIEGHLFPAPYSSGVEDFFSNRNGYVKGIVSAGVGFVAERIAKELSFDFVVGIPIEVKNGTFTGEGECISYLWRKDLDILKVANENHLNLQRTIYVGDNDNDIACFKLAGISVAFNPKTEETKRAAKYVISDFRELNDILKEIEK